MNRVGMRCNAASWLCAMIAVSLLATSAQAAGEKQKAKAVAPKSAAADTSIRLVPKELRALPLERIRTDSYMSPPVFPPLGHQTRDEADRLRLLNNPKSGALTVAPYPAPDFVGDELVFRGTPSLGTTYQLDGKPVTPSLTRPDSSGPVPRTTTRRKPAVPRPH